MGDFRISARGAASAASSANGRISRPGRRKCRELGSAPGAPQAAGVSFDGAWVEPGFKAQSPKINLVEFFKEHRGVENASSCLLVLGEAGSGKSALLRRWFVSAARRWLDSDGSGPLPVFACASCLRLDAGGSALALSCGADGPAVTALEEYWRRGNLLLFLDGLDENQRCLDFSDPDVGGFWQIASRNRCILSVRSRFWKERIKRSCWRRYFTEGRCSEMSLEDWTPLQAKSLFVQLAGAGSRNEPRPPWHSRLDHLAGLPAEQIEHLFGVLNLSPLQAFSFARFFAVQERLPKNSYELMEQAIETTLDWEVDKPGSCLGRDGAWGVLQKTACERPANGRRCRGFGEFWQAVLRDYPFLEGKSSKVFDFLGALPFVRLDRQQARVLLQEEVAVFLAARQEIARLSENGRERRKATIRIKAISN